MALKHMDAAKAKAYKPQPQKFEYESRDAIMYAIGIGCTRKDDLRYVYEGADGFVPYPTYVVASGLLANELMGWPGIEFDLTRILHGEQYIESFAPLPADGKLRSECRLLDVLDKGSGACFLTEVTTYDDNTNQKLAVQQFATFQVGSGNFGGQRTCPEEKKPEPVPQRAPDAIIEERTNFEQPTMYRLGSLDINPLHVDPEFAKMSGFKEPIMHGLCTLGFATRHIIKTWADNDVTRFKSIKVRFATPVIPGQTLQTETWKEGNKIAFQVKVKETGKVVVSQAYVELKQASATPTIPTGLSKL